MPEVTGAIQSVSQLAIFGGSSIRKGGWPKWPQSTDETVEALKEVALSGRWAISGLFTGAQCREKRFAQNVATYHGVPCAVPTVNGTSALTIALEALGVSAGDEVIVPGLTWVACASAVAGIGAVPVLVDIDPDTLSISLDAARRAISERTSAILLVHAYSSCADIDGFLALSEGVGVPLIEDCSQAQGASWRGRKVGSFGQVGAFSLQQSKVLTCGEGGVAMTSDAELYDRMLQFRADGRRWARAPVAGKMELEEVGSVQGRNYCMSEFHAAIASVQLSHLDLQNRLREKNAATLTRYLEAMPGLSIPTTPDAVTERTYYQYPVRLDPRVLGDLDMDQVVAALCAELDLFVERIDAPMNANRLYNPFLSPRTSTDPAMRALMDPARYDLPQATAAYDQIVCLPHWCLIGTVDDMAEIASAFEKIVANREALRPCGRVPSMS